MSASYVTEKALAESLKKLMLTYPMRQIRVQMITDATGLTRHTFYNHFKDVYDLLGWIYQHELITDLEKYCNESGWKQAILQVLYYTLENKTICLNTFRSLGRDHLERFLYQVFEHVLESVIEDITKGQNVANEMKKEVADFYTNALIGVFIGWLKQNLKEEPETIANRIEKMLQGHLRYLLCHQKN